MARVWGVGYVAQYVRIGFGLGWLFGIGFIVGLITLAGVVAIVIPVLGIFIAACVVVGVVIGVIQARNDMRHIREEMHDESR